jgi:DHA1 family bicyclomycin/chloramphenicol resistance-like MFS transporter
VNRRSHNTLILVLGAFTAIGPFSIDMYLPGFPAIARDLGTDISHVGLSLTSYFIGISLGQLGYGPLLDKYGRKKPIIAGLILYVIAAVGCGLAPSIQWLVVMRFMLATGACVGIVASRAIVRDLFPLNEIARIFSTLMLVLAVSPLLAPSVGAYVAVFSWRYIFVILALIAVAILAAVFYLLPESRHGDRTISLHPATLSRTYLAVLKEPTFFAYGCASAAASAGLFAYIADAPFVFMNLFGLTEREFGIIFSLSACGVIGASQLNRLWLKKRTSKAISFVAVILQSAVALLLLVAVITGAPPGLLYACLFFYLAGLGTLSPNTTAVAIGPFTSNAGTASALMGSMQMAAGAIGSSLVSYFHDGTARPMAAVLLFASITSLGLQWSYRSGRREQHDARMSRVGS